MSPVIRKRKKKFTISSKYLLLILCGICVALMVFTFRTSLFEGPFKTVAGYVVVPFQKGIAEVGGYFSDRSRELEQLREVLAQNQALQEQVDALTMSAGTYNHPNRTNPFDETSEEKRERIRMGLKNRNGSTRGDR